MALTPILLTKSQIGTLLSMTPGTAARVLAERGVLPVDFGRGRGKGPRWYSHAVEHAIRQMHDDAQIDAPANPQTRAKRPRVPKSGHLVQGRSAAELYAELTASNPVQ